jgi:hypothetical protein
MLAGAANAHGRRPTSGPVGGKLALIRGNMPEHRILDGCPGSCPEIRADGDSVVFRFTIASLRDFRLTLRCDSEGGVWASVADDDRPSMGTDSQS